MLQPVRPVCSLNRSRGVAGEAGLAMTNLATYKFVHIDGKATQFPPLRGPSLSGAQSSDMTWYDPGSCIMAFHLLVAGWFVIYGAVCGWLVDWAWFHLVIGWIVDRFGLGFVSVFAGRQQHRHWVATVETLAGDAIATLRQAMWPVEPDFMWFTGL